MFVPVKRLVGDVEPFERLPGASGLSLGMAAVYSGAAGLAKCLRYGVIWLIYLGIV